MGRLVLFISILISCWGAQSAPLPTAKEICLKNLDDMMKLIVNCSWDTTAVAPRAVFQQYLDNGSYICTGRLVCGNTDPVLSQYPYEVALTSCNNGPVKCATSFTANCKTTMRQKEEDRCKNLAPDSHHYEPGPPLQPPYK